jgi:hypothetical protein
MTRFDPSRREVFLALYGAGKTLEQACAGAGTSRPTVARWRARGTEPDADVDVREFAAAFAAIQAQRSRHMHPKTSGEDDVPLTADDALRLLEDSARGGSVVAQKAVLTERRRREEATNATDALREGLPGARDPDHDRYIELEADEPFIPDPGEDR